MLRIFKGEIGGSKITEDRFVFRMDFELDEDRIRADGLDVEAKWQELDNMLSGLQGVRQISRGVVVTDNSGMRSWITELLENKEWFMKYVCRWEVSDPIMREDVLKTFRRIGKIPVNKKCKWEESLNPFSHDFMME